MAAVRSYPVHGDAGAAELRPAEAAMRAGAAARVVVVHDALTVGRIAFRHAGPARDHDAAGLVAGNERVLQLAQAQGGLSRPRRRAVELEVRAAHPGSLHLDDHLARTRRRIGKAAQLDLAVAEKGCPAHGFSYGFRVWRYCALVRSRGGNTNTVSLARDMDHRAIVGTLSAAHDRGVNYAAGGWPRVMREL